MPSGNDRRGGARHAHELDVELHLKDNKIPLRAVDVSRHGMFLATKLIFPIHRAVLLHVKLRSGTFETMATIVRSVQDTSRGPTLGIGVKIFCLGADARARWDGFVAGLASAPLDLPTRPSRAAASFLVQPDDPAELLAFFQDNVMAARTVHVSPAVRQLGADVEFVLVHPTTHAESVHRATVVEWSADHPQRMGVRFAPVDAAAKDAFRAFLGARATSREGAPLVASERPRWTEYALYSPKLAGREAREDVTDEVMVLDVPASLPPQPPEELDVIEGQLLEHPELELVDKRALFDFNWNAADHDDEPQ